MGKTVADYQYDRENVGTSEDPDDESEDPLRAFDNSAEQNLEDLMGDDEDEGIEGEDGGDGDDN